MESKIGCGTLLRLLPALLVLAVVTALLLLVGVVDPVDREFRVDDPDLMHPLKDETFSSTVAGVIMAVVNVGTILLVHVVVYRTRFFGETSRYQIGEAFLSTAVIVLMNFTITEVFKLTVSKPRPHFLEVCELPDDVTGEFASASQCTGDEDEVTEAMKSFISGHSSFSFALAVFAAVYLWKRLPVESSWRTMIPVYDVFLFAVAAVIANSRITDFKHFPVDVLAGSIVGAAIGLFGALNLISPRTLRWWWSPPPTHGSNGERKLERSNSVMFDDVA